MSFLKSILTNNKDVNILILLKLEFDDLREVLKTDKTISNYNNNILWMNYLNRKADFETIKSVIRRPWKEFALLLEKYRIQERECNEEDPKSLLQNYNHAIYFPIEDGYQDLVEFYLRKIHLYQWNWYIYYAAKGGHLEMVKIFLQKLDSHDWDWYMHPALLAGHRHLVEFFISQGANMWNYHLQSSAEGGYLDLVEMMIEKGADSWNLGMYGAARGNHLFLVEYFITKGANNWKMVLQGAHHDLVPFFEQKIRETEVAPFI